MAFQFSPVQTLAIRFITSQLSEKLNANIKVGSVSISFFNKVTLNEVLIEDLQADTLLYVDKMVASIDKFRIKQRTIDLSSVKFQKTLSYLSLDEKRLPNYKFLLDALRSDKKPSSGSWEVSCNSFSFEDTQLGYSYFKKDEVNLINLNNIDLDVNDFVLNKDSIYLKINRLRFDNNQDLMLKNMSGVIVSYPHIIKISELSLETANSTVNNAYFMLDQSKLDDQDYTNSGIEILVRPSTISLHDVGQFVPSIRGMNEKIKISGHIYGTIANLMAKNMSVSLGKNSKLDCELSFDGFPDFQNTYTHLNLKNLSLDFADIANIKLPYSSQNEYPVLPDFLVDAGIISYKGVFNGFPTDFIAYGTMHSNFGQLTTDISLNPADNNTINIKGTLETVDFMLGSFTQLDNVGAISFNGSINGTYKRNTSILEGNVNGFIDNLDYMSYQYSNIVLDGLIMEKKFEGSMKIDDENLKGQFSGNVDLNNENSIFDFELLIEKANLSNLHIDKKYQDSKLTFDLRANFTGNNIDNINGNIWFDEGFYSNSNDSVAFKSIMINTFADSTRHISLKSDFVDANLSGSYSFSTFKNSISNIIHKFIPESGLQYTPVDYLNYFNLDIKVKDASTVMYTFFPDIYVGPAQINMHFYEKNNDLELYASFPELRYKNFYFNDYTLFIQTVEQLVLKTRVSELDINNKNFKNLAILTEAKDNKATTSISWNNMSEITYGGLFSAVTSFSTDENEKLNVNINILPTNVIVADTIWKVIPSSITIDTTGICINDFQIKNDYQSFKVSGEISRDSTSFINFHVDKFNLNNLNTWNENNKTNLQGSLNGTIGISDLYRNPFILANLKMDNLVFNSSPIGNISLRSEWNQSTESVQSELIVGNDKNNTLYGYGSYYPSRDSLALTASLDKFPLPTLYPFLKSVFEKIDGYGTGDVDISGNFKKIMLDGDVLIENGGLKIGYLQTTYSINDTLRFRQDSMIFNNITLYDPDGNKGQFNGSIKHHNFSNMDYNLAMSFPRIMIFNTTSKDNQQFYGKVYARGQLQLTGHGRQIDLTGNASTLSGTSIDISLISDKQAQVYDFIHFINTDKEENVSFHAIPRRNEGLDINVNANITPDAHFKLLIGDIIQGSGSGSLQIRIDPQANIELYGTFQVEEGDYKFNIPNFNIEYRDFEIEKGGTIAWNGDPANAMIDIRAMYRLRTSISEIMAYSRDEMYSQRIPVVCVIDISENLNSPKIAFDILFPTIEERVKDNIRQFFSTEEEMQRQVIFLLALGQFYTPDYMRGTYASSSSNLVGRTVSEILSNQLSNWLSEINNQVNIGVNYRPGDQMTGDEIELALSTQILNDRVTINGNIGNNNTQSYNNSNSNIVGDFDINVKLTKNGKLQFKAYNRSNNDLLYETSPYTQGVGVSYKEDYDNLDELYRKFKAIFRRRDRFPDKSREIE